MRPVLLIASVLWAAAAQAEAPRLQNEPVATSVAGVPLKLSLRIDVDPGRKPFDAAAFVRAPGAASWVRLPLSLELPGGAWVATLPAAQAVGELQYYFEAFDDQGEGPSRIGTPAKPLVVQFRELPPPVASVAASPAPAAASASIATPAATPAAPETPYRRRLGIGLVAAGGAAAVAGGIFGILALGRHNAALQSSRQGGSDVAALNDAARDTARRADLLYGLGAVLGLGGGLLWATAPADGPPQLTLHLGAASAAVRAEF